MLLVARRRARPPGGGSAAMPRRERERAVVAEAAAGMNARIRCTAGGDAAGNLQITEDPPKGRKSGSRTPQDGIQVQVVTATEAWRRAWQNAFRSFRSARHAPVAVPSPHRKETPADAERSAIVDVEGRHVRKLAAVACTLVAGPARGARWEGIVRARNELRRRRSRWRCRRSSRRNQGGKPGAGRSVRTAEPSAPQGAGLSPPLTAEEAVTDFFRRSGQLSSQCR